MRKQILYLAGIAAIFASCSREAIEAPEEVQGPRHIRIQASIEDTRTSLNIDGTTGTYSWQPMETIAVMEENGSKPCEFTVTNAVNGYFEGEATNALIGAVSPFTALGMYDGDEFMLSLSGEYDYADGTNAVMVAGAPTVVPEGDMQKFTFKHAAGLVMITYENLPFGTKGVRFTTNKPIVGEWVFNSSENVVLNGPTTGSSTAYVMFEEPIGNDELNQPFSFYIPVPVNDYTGLEIALVDNGKNDIAGTKKKMASKQFSVALGDVVKFPTITLTPAPVQEAGYEKVTSTTDLEAGQYLIVCETQNVAFDGSLTTLDAVKNLIVVTPSNGRIEESTETVAAEFTIAEYDGAYSIKSASGKYIGRDSENKNGLESGDSPLKNTISITNGTATITGTKGPNLLYYNGGNNSRFRYYITEQTAIQLYKKVAAGPVGGKTEVSLSFDPAGPFTVNSSEAENFSEPALVNPAGVPVTYSMTGGNELVDINPQTGELTFVNGLDACNITVTASFAGSSVYEAATASYQITVVAPLNGIAALKALVPSSGTEYPFTMQLTNAVVTSVSTQTTNNGTNTRIFMEDNGAGILLFNTGADLAVKDVLNGVVTGTAVLYKGNQYEITDIDISAATKSTQATVPCEDYTIEEILDLGMDIESMRVKVTYAEAVKSGDNINLKQGDKTIRYYDPTKCKTLNGGELVNVTGYYTKFGTTAGLAVYSANDVEILDKPVVTLTGVPTASLSTAEQDITVTYSVSHPVSGAEVTASTEANWLDAEAEDGEILIMVGSNDGENVYTEERTGVVTVSYPYTADQTITITQSGNSFAISYATVTGGTLSGPARAKPNTEVTLVATPANNYTFDDNWTVTPEAQGVSVSVANDKFTMPACDVSVSGSFTYSGTIVLGPTVTNTFTNKDLAISENNGMTWSSSISANSFETASPSRGVQFGTAKGEFTITGEGYTGGIQKISVVVSTNGTADTNTIDVKVGTTTIGSQVKLAKENNVTISFESSELIAGDDIVIMVNDVTKSVYFKSITINPSN